MDQLVRKRPAPTRVLLFILIIGVILAASVTAASAYTITASAGNHGTISPSGAVPVDPGSDILFFIDPVNGYHPDQMTIDGKVSSAPPFYKFSNVNADHTISVTFAPDLGSFKVVSDPNGASIFVDGTNVGTTPKTVDNVQAGIHQLRLILSGYSDYTGSVTVEKDQLTIVPKVSLVLLPPVTTTVPTTVPTTVRTTTPTPVPTTVPTTVKTTVTTAVPTTTSTTVPPTTVTTTAPVTSVPTQTTTVATTVPTVTPTATSTLPYIFPTPTERVPLPTTASLSNLTPEPTQTLTMNGTSLVVTPVANSTPGPAENNSGFVEPVVTTLPVTSPNGSANMTGSGLQPPAGLASWNVIFFLFIAAIPLVLLLAHDYLGLGHLSFPQPLAVRAGVAFGQVVCGFGLLFVLSRMIALLPALSNTLTLPLLLIVLLLGAYLIFSALALAAGSLLSSPLRWTLKVHVVIGVIVLIVTPILIFSLGQGEVMAILVTIVAAPVSALLALWQDHSLALQVQKRGFPYGFFNGEETRVPSGSDPYRRSNATRPDIFPPELADRYTSVDFLGMGGISHVFKAMRLKDGKTVAVKIPIRFDETTGKSFMKEILAWEGLRHPNIVEITEVNILPIPYVEMEFLKSVLADMKTPIPVREAAEIVEGVANGLAYAHEQGIIHRDIKPQNILIDQNGVPKISDWGMSRLIGSSAIPTVAGFSLAYAAPEQISPGRFGETDERTDIYQLGVVFYELVTGKLLFPGDDLAEVSNAIISRM
ncbi:MAG: protein kinase, partial [Methanoregulaceae archaeon]|nr:protein kinase [Methanoregulaceae archaeon]